jgi:ribosomal protein L37AE/L43A
MISSKACPKCGKVCSSIAGSDTFFCSKCKKSFEKPRLFTKGELDLINYKSDLLMKSLDNYKMDYNKNK